MTDLAGRALTDPSNGAPVPRWTATAPIVVRGQAVGRLELRAVRGDIFGTENTALHKQLNGLLEVCAGLALGLALLAAGDRGRDARAPAAAPHRHAPSA